MGYTALHESMCKSIHIADMTDTDPELTAFWCYVMAAGAPWGRFPAHTKLLKARVCPLVDRWSGSRLEQLVDGLIEHGLLMRYTCERTNVECLAITNYSRYNSAGRQYHRMTKPEFGPPPNWTPPKDLLDYLSKVSTGAFKRHSLREEAAKFGVDCAKHGLSESTTPKDQVPRTYSQGHTPKDLLPGSSEVQDTCRNVGHDDDEKRDATHRRVENAYKMRAKRETPRDQLPGTNSQGPTPKDQVPKDVTGTETETETETEQRLTTPSPTTGGNGAPCAHGVSAQGANGRATARSPVELDDDALFEQVNGKRPKDVSERAAYDTCKARWIEGRPIQLPGGEIKHGWGSYKFPDRAARGRTAAAGSTS